MKAIDGIRSTRLIQDASRGKTMLHVRSLNLEVAGVVRTTYTRESDDGYGIVSHGSRDSNRVSRPGVCSAENHRLATAYIGVDLA